MFFTPPTVSQITPAARAAIARADPGACIGGVVRVKDGSHLLCDGLGRACSLREPEADALIDLNQVPGPGMAWLLARLAQEYGFGEGAAADPPQFVVTPSYRCNRSCVHCLVGGAPTHDETVPLEAVLAGIAGFKNAFPNGVLHVSGGEPLLFPHLQQVMEAAQGLRVRLFTNATLVTQETVGLLGALDRIQVSIDGVTPEVADAIRGPGYFHAAMRGLAILRVALPHIPIDLAFVLLRANADDIADGIVEFAERHSKPGRVRWASNNAAGRGATQAKPSAQQHRRLAAAAVELMARGQMDFPAARGWMQGCGSAHILRLAPDGVFACVQHPACRRLGPPTLQFVDQVVAGWRQLIADSGLPALEPCNRCPVRGACGGPCRGANPATAVCELSDVASRLNSVRDIREAGVIRRRDLRLQGGM